MELDFENKLIEVCSECSKACCWHGEFMCSENRNAGTKIEIVSSLRILDLEHYDNWSDEKLKAVYGDPAPNGYLNIERIWKSLPGVTPVVFQLVPGSPAIKKVNEIKLSTSINQELAWPCYACVNNQCASTKKPCDRCQHNCNYEPTLKGHGLHFLPILIIK